MLWVILAILSHFVWAWANITDKYVVENRVKNPYVYVWWQWIFAILALVIVPFVGFELNLASSYLWLMLASVFGVIGSLFYVKSLQLEEVSRIGLWWNLIPVFTLGIAWFTIGQKLSVIQFLAFFLLLFGALVGSLHAGWVRFKISKALKYIIVACVSYSIYAVIYSHVVVVESFAVSYVWMNIFGFFMSFLLVFSPSIRHDFVSLWKKMDVSLISIFFGVSILNHIGAFLNVWALSLGLAALVFAMEGFQAMFILIFATIISVFNPKLLKEELDKKNIILKLVALVFMIVGILILNLG